MNPQSEIRNPKSPPPVIGLVGGIASGKSLVASQFARLGCVVVDADRMGHEILQEERVCRAIRRRFGPEVLDEAGRVDRERLGRVVFSDAARLEALNRIVHPTLWKRFREAVRAARRRRGAKAVVLDAALILEKRLDRLCDRVVYIKAEKGVRQARAKQARGWGPAELARRERMQLPLKVKRHRADYTIDNSTSPEHTFDQVRAILLRVVNR